MEAADATASHGVNVHCGGAPNRIATGSHCRQTAAMGAHRRSGCQPRTWCELTHGGGGVRGSGMLPCLGGGTAGEQRRLAGARSTVEAPAVHVQLDGCRLQC